MAPAVNRMFTIILSYGGTTKFILSSSNSPVILLLLDTRKVSHPELNITIGSEDVTPINVLSTLVQF